MAPRQYTDEELLSALDYGIPPSAEVEVAAARRIRELLALVDAEWPGACAVYEHTKSGGLYAVLSEDRPIESSGGPVREGDVITTYINRQGEIFHRPSPEFRDGRFRPVAR